MSPEVKFEHIHVCAPDGYEPNFQFTDPFEHDQEEFYEVVMDTIIGACLYYTVEANQDVPEEDQVLYQMVVPLPVVFEEWHDEE